MAPAPAKIPKVKAPPFIAPPKHKAPPACLQVPKAMPAALMPGGNGGVSNDMNVRMSNDSRLSSPPMPSGFMPSDNSYAHSWELPPAVN